MSSSLSMFQHKIQPRSSAERDNSLLLHSALKAASTDIAHRLLDYASLDKIDCEASCILISLANHEPSLPKNHDLEPKKNMKEETVVDQPIVVEEKKVHVAPTSKTDPIMLLMAAAKVVDGNDLKMERKKRHSHQRSMDREAYPNGRYYLKQNNKRIRTSPPSPAPTNTSHYKVDTWQKTKEYPDNSFSRQYHSMKQNPKVKQNALHTYITYMIYNDLAHGNTRQTYNTSSTTTSTKATTTTIMTPPVYNNMTTKYQQKPSLSSSTSSAATSATIATPMESPWYHHDDRSILARPLTAFLWNNETSSVNSLDAGRKDMMILPPLSANARPSPSISTYDRLPPV